MPCFEKLTDHDVTVWTDHVQETSALVDRLQDADAVVLFRERTSVSRELLEQLPNLRLISQRGVYPHVDVEACTDTNTLLCSKLPKGGAANYAASELTWGLILAGMRQIPQQMASLKAGQWQMGVGKSVRNRTIGLVGFGRIGGAVAEVARAFGMKVQWWGSEAGRERLARRRTCTQQPRRILCDFRCRFSTRPAEWRYSRNDYRVGFPSDEK